MFQSFTGNSRRPRQVNLSGHNNDPFAATAWTPTASGTQKTVANAQQERLQRQQERARLNAAKTLQRTWRGHKTRKEVADGWRNAWDKLENSIAHASPSPAILPEELTLLLSFFNPRKQEDIHRLAVFGDRVSQQDSSAYFSRDDVHPSLLRLTKIALDALAKTDHFNWLESILRLVMKLWQSDRNISLRYSRSYYKNLSRIVTNTSFSTSRQRLLLDAVHIPLIYDLEQKDSDQVIYAYSAIGIELLTTPNLLELLGPNDLARIIDTKALSVALLPELTSAVTAIPESDHRLWLVAQFIALCRLQSGKEQESEHLRLLSVLFSSLGDELFHRIDDLQKSEDPENDEDRRPPLPKFVVEQIATLAEKESIMNLFSRFRTIDIHKKEDAALLASYALTLLRVFPRRGDEIRMWLHYSSLSVGNSGPELPAVRFFWQVVRETDLFRAIATSTESTLGILKSLSSHGASSTTSYTATSQEWHVIMLFLELYAFGMRFTDDEEFLAGGNVLDASQPTSRFGKSALPLDDVKSLTIFLKNLAFTMIFNANEILGNQGMHADGNLGAYLAAVSSQSPATSSNVLRSAEMDKKPDERHQTNNIAGLAYSGVRELVTSVLRALYERDSRRRFLPRDHWLMTSKFDMGSFIPAVVAEEERRREVDVTDEPEELDDDEEDIPQTGIIGMQRPSRAVQMEKLRRQQRKAARTRALAAIGPRLEILQNMPFVIPFSTRVQIFGQFVLLDQTRRRGGYVDPDQWRMSVMMNSPGPRELAREALGKHHARIRRQNIFEDAMEQFYSLGAGLKEPIQITFVDKFDSVEAGIDGGGVTKEFLTSITTEAFLSPEGQNRFVANDQNLLYPNPSALDERKSILKDAGMNEGSQFWNETIRGVLREYEFLGRIVGKCLYEGILIDISFAGFFLLKWALSGNVAQYRANINDLRDLDEDLYRGLLKLKNYPGDVQEFGLDFTIDDVVSSPGEPVRTVTRELLPNGSNIPVTKENRISYISLVTRHRLQIQPFHQTQAFLRGLGEIIKPTWLSMFNQSELQTLIGGATSELDIDDLRRNTEYGGVYSIGDDGQEHSTVRFFWQVMKELNDTDRRKVLKYVTSTPRAPLLGFAQLNPKFSIRDAGRDQTRLPSTSTCVNLLKLPMYSTKRVLKEKLLYAVNAGAGFDLS